METPWKRLKCHFPDCWCHCISPHSLLVVRMNYPNVTLTILAVGVCLKQKQTEAENLNPVICFKGMLKGSRNSWTWYSELWSAWQGGAQHLDSEILEVFFNLNDPVILNRKQKQHKSFQNYVSADSSWKIQAGCLASMAGNLKKKIRDGKESFSSSCSLHFPNVAACPISQKLILLSLFHLCKQSWNQRTLLFFLFYKSRHYSYRCVLLGMFLFTFFHFLSHSGYPLCMHR